MLINVPVDQIDDNPYQRRQDYGDVAALAADIQANGLLQTPVGRLVYTTTGEFIPDIASQGACRRIQEDGFPAGLRVQLAFGHRRLRAYRHMQTVDGPADTSQTLIMPVEIRPLTDDQMLDYVWSENQHRSDINPIEQAELLAEKLDRARAAGGNQQTVADSWGLDRSTIANKLRLLDLPADVQQAVRARQLSERQAQALLPVIDLQAKLNGSPVKWADTGGESWGQRSPASYIAQVLENPAAATSDRIRDYTLTAIRHAGQPLGDDFAKYEAGDGRAIIQSTCKGCPKRINQTCLAPACHAARLKRYLAVLPEWASRETGLPHSENDYDFPDAYPDRLAIQADWKAGAHGNLVCGIAPDGYTALRAYGEAYIQLPHILNDWKTAVILGRRRGTLAAALGFPNPDEVELRPPAADLAHWRKAHTKRDKERLTRAKEIMRDRLQPLAADPDALSTLMAMLDGYGLGRRREAGEIFTPPSLLADLFDLAWKRVNTGNYDETFGNRHALRNLLALSGANPDTLDPADPAERLTEIGQIALLEHDEARDRWAGYHIEERLARVRAALAEFDVSPHVLGDPNLEQLAAYLRAAVDREENLAAQTPQEN